MTPTTWVGHFHYVLFGGSVFGIYAAVYHWFPKITGRLLNEKLGQLHFVLTFIGTILTFTPMHQLGMQGMPRRVAMYDPQFEALNQLVTVGAYILAVSVVPFYLNVIWSWSKGKEAGPNPWDAKTLEWTTASPPIIENWENSNPLSPKAPTSMGMTRRTSFLSNPPRSLLCPSSVGLKIPLQSLGEGF